MGIFFHYGHNGPARPAVATRSLRSGAVIYVMGILWGKYAHNAGIHRVRQLRRRRSWAFFHYGHNGPARPPVATRSLRSGAVASCQDATMGIVGTHMG